jgi:hypothetical protein
MFQRSVSVDDVRRVLDSGETIEAYPDDQPYPSRLVLGWVGTRPLHVVVADSTEANEVVVIAVYEPDLTRWNEAFRRRREQ